MYKEMLERIARYFSSDRYLPELQEAREVYFQRTGKVFEEDPMFEGRITAFLEWFLLDRLLPVVGVPPVRLFWMMFEDSLGEGERETLLQMQRTNHSLFQVQGARGELSRLKDLATGEIHDVLTDHKLPGVTREDVLDARLIQMGGNLRFCESLWIHPLEAHPYIFGELKAHHPPSREWLDTFLHDLALMKLKKEQYKHIPVAQIYSQRSFPQEREKPST